MQQRLFSIICCVLILIGGAGTLMYFTSPATEENKISTTYSVEELEKEIKEVSASLLLLKHSKQECKDSLNEYQTIAEYKGIQFFCNERDAEIEQLKNRLAAMLTMPYEQLDANLNDSKQEQQMDMLVNGTGTALEKLTAFLQSE